MPGKFCRLHYNRLFCLWYLNHNRLTNNQTYKLTSDKPRDEPDEGTDEPRDEHNTFRWITSTLMKPLTHTMTYESLQLHTLCFALSLLMLRLSVNGGSNVYKETKNLTHLPLTHFIDEVSNFHMVNRFLSQVRNLMLSCGVHAEPLCFLIPTQK